MHWIAKYIIRVSFLFFFSKHLYGKVLDANNQKSLLRGGFRTDRESVFIIHGFNGTSKDTHMRYLKDGKTTKIQKQNVKYYNSNLHIYSLLIEKIQRYHGQLATVNILSMLFFGIVKYEISRSMYGTGNNIFTKIYYFQTAFCKLK